MGGILARDTIPLAKSDRGIPVGEKIIRVIDSRFEGYEKLKFSTMTSAKTQEQEHEQY